MSFIIDIFRGVFMEIILLRHGETMDNNLKIYSRSETGLSFDGKIQIKNVREKILKMDLSGK